MSDPSFLHETEEFLYRNIPLTRAMGVKVESSDPSQLVLTAPLEENHNHLGTAFGGSISTLATLAGYGLLWIYLKGHQAHIVIRRSSIDYRRPVRGNLRAICRAPDEAVLAAFEAAFRQKGKARIELQVTLEEKGEICVFFEGAFVALR